MVSWFTLPRLQVVTRRISAGSTNAASTQNVRSVLLSELAASRSSQPQTSSPARATRTR